MNRGRTTSPKEEVDSKWKTAGTVSAKVTDGRRQQGPAPKWAGATTLWFVIGGFEISSPSHHHHPTLIDNPFSRIAALLGFGPRPPLEDHLDAAIRFRVRDRGCWLGTDIERSRRHPGCIHAGPEVGRGQNHIPEKDRSCLKTPSAACAGVATLVSIHPAIPDPRYSEDYLALNVCATAFPR